MQLTPSTRLKIAVPGEEDDTIALASLLYDIFSVGGDFDLTAFVILLSSERPFQGWIPGYGDNCTVTIVK